MSVDRSNMFDVIADLPNQVEDSIKICSPITLQYESSQIRNIVFCGIGGSSIGGMLLKEYLYNDLKIPFIPIRNYDIPSFIDKDTLLFVSSYSGNTEEALSAYEKAKQKEAKIIVLTSGGKLKNFAEIDNIPIIPIPPSGMPPRCALGYSFILPLLVLIKLGLIEDKSDEISETAVVLRKQSQSFSSADHPRDNQALELAYKLMSSIPVIYCKEQFIGPVGYRWKCQFNENSKRTAFNNYFTELNHNEICGWESNDTIPFKPYVIILNDKKSRNEKTNKITTITKSILTEENIPFVQCTSTGESLLSQIFSLLYLGDWTSYYLAVINNTDPTPIMKIEEIKRRMTENKY